MTQPLATLNDVWAAYRLLLERDPDPDGLMHYADKIQNGLTVGALRRSLLSSKEFRNVISVQTDYDFVVVVDAREPEFGRTISRTRSWEPHIIRLIRANLHEGDVYVDVGANVGLMAFSAAKIVGASGKVIAFEPNQDNASCFLQGVKENEFENVLLYQFALSDHRRIFNMWGSSNSELIEPNDYSMRPVQSVTGDYLLRHELRVNFIKLDIEGHEPFALKGLSDTLVNHEPLVLCEFNPRCLKDNIGMNPHAFADELFKLADEIQVVEHDGNWNSVTSAAGLMMLWSEKNRQATESGFLPGGMLHFDLFFKVKGTDD